MTASQQQPIGSGFDASSTAADVLQGVDLHGRVAVVTGGASGFGLAITRALAAAGATVVVPASTGRGGGAGARRDPDRRDS